MAELSPKQSRVVDAVLADDVPLLSPRVFSKVPEQHGGDDYSKRALAVPEKENKSVRQQRGASQKGKKALRQELTAEKKKNESLQLERDASQKGKKALRQELTAEKNKNESLQLERDASQETIKALEQELLQQRDEFQNKIKSLSASQNENKELGQKPGAAQGENKSLGQKLSAIMTFIFLRQLFNEFRQTVDFDKDLLKKARKEYPKDFKKTLKNRKKKEINTFSGLVIHLATEQKNLLKEKKNLLKEKKNLVKKKKNLQKEENLLKDKKDRNRSSTIKRIANRLAGLEPAIETIAKRLAELKSEIESIDSGLAKLKAVACSVEEPVTKWTGTLSELYYYWCLLAGDANEACHPDMTEDLLRDMKNRAERGEFKYGDVNLRDIVVEAIHPILKNT